MKKQASKMTTGSLMAVGVDFWLTVAAVGLLSIGIIMVASSSVAIADHYNHDAFYYLKKHLTFIAIGLLLSAVVMAISSQHLSKMAWFFLFLALALLILVLIPHLGVRVNGARRWLNLGVARFQVVEAVKLALIVYLASYLVRHQHAVQNEFMGALKPLLIAATVAVLLLLQPDFGSAVLLFAITLMMIFIAGARWRYLALVGLTTVGGMAMVAVAQPYRVRRLTNFMDPFEHKYDSGFQLVQALIAIGRGEWTGVGLGGSVQKLFYLPEMHTDFIFSVYAEETGYLGVLLLIGLFVLLIWRIFAVARQALAQGNLFGAYTAAGIGAWLALQAFLSMAVNLGLLPTKGLTLPLISSGGSAILMNLIALAVVLRISYENRRQQQAAIRHPREASA
jgi:cell division protein FtsW